MGCSCMVNLICNSGLICHFGKLLEKGKGKGKKKKEEGGECLHFLGLTNTIQQQSALTMSHPHRAKSGQGAKHSSLM